MNLTEQDERRMLDAHLDRQRDEIDALLEGLSDDEARQRLVPSLTTPLGLVKHATFVEQVWFHHRVAGVAREDVGIVDTIDESFTLLPADTVEGVRAGFRAACDRSRRIAGDHDLDEKFSWHQGPVDLRYVYGHLIAEHARHAGHGDILVELVQARRP